MADTLAQWLDEMEAYAALCVAPGVLALHAAECPGCPWDGRSIFPKEVR